VYVDAGRGERLGFSGLAPVLRSIWLSRSLGELGQFAEAQACAEEGLGIATTADQPFSLIGAHVTVGILGLRRGHFDRATAAFRSGMELGRAWEIHAWLENDAGFACALALQGERDEAIRVLEEASTTVPGTGVGLFLARRAAWFAEAAREGGRPQEARRLAEQALRLARAHKERGDEAWALRLLGDLASDREPLDFPAAETRYSDALALARTLEMHPLVAHCHRGLGLLYRRTGARERAQRDLGLARDLYREMGMAFWLERTDVELAELQ